MRFKCRECGYSTSTLFHFEDIKLFHEHAHWKEVLWNFENDLFKILNDANCSSDDKVRSIEVIFKEYRNYKFAGWERIENE